VRVLNNSLLGRCGKEVASSLRFDFTVDYCARYRFILLILLKFCILFYFQACDNGRGAVLLSVARGKVSEGIDFGQSLISDLLYNELLS